jgi:hypothetical protein
MNQQSLLQLDGDQSVIPASLVKRMNLDEFLVLLAV